MTGQLHPNTKFNFTLSEFNWQTKDTMGSTTLPNDNQSQAYLFKYNFRQTVNSPVYCAQKPEMQK